MNVVSAVCICVAGALVCALLRVQKPEFRVAVAISAGLCALMLSMDGIRTGVNMLRNLCTQAGMDSDAVGVMLRAIGIALIVEFGAQLCRDADESALAGRVELAGRVTMLGMSIPLLGTLTQQILEILP